MTSFTKSFLTSMAAFVALLVLATSSDAASTARAGVAATTASAAETSAAAGVAVARRSLRVPTIVDDENHDAIRRALSVAPAGGKAETPPPKGTKSPSSGSSSKGPKSSSKGPSTSSKGPKSSSKSPGTTKAPSSDVRRRRHRHHRRHLKGGGMAATMTQGPRETKAPKSIPISPRTMSPTTSAPNVIKKSMTMKPVAGGTKPPMMPMTKLA